MTMGTTGTDAVDEVRTSLEAPAPSRGADEAQQMADEARDEQRTEARRFVGMGLGIGAVGALSAAAFGAVCPVCVVAAPALVAMGVVKHVRAKGGG